MKILNLYAGIGGNRSLWGDKHQVTAVEWDEKIAAIYRKRFPNDIMIVGDAVEYFHEHMDEFDFIWASPPCVTHTQIMNLTANISRKSVKLPDMTLYSIIIYLQSWFKGRFCVENVVPYYEPLIKPSYILERHTFWTNFPISRQKISYIKIGLHKDYDNYSTGTGKMDEKNLNLLMNNLKISKDIFDSVPKNLMVKTLRNCVNPDLAAHILDCALQSKKQQLLF